MVPSLAHRTATLCGLLLLSTLPSFAQQDAQPGAAAPGVGKPGDVVRVTLRNSAVRTGRLSALEGSTLTIEQGETSNTLAFDDIAKVERRGDSLKNGTIIGLCAGAAAGIALGSAFEGTETGESGRTATGLVAGAAWGAGIGALADFLVKGWTTTYRAPGSAAVKIVPVVGRSRFGVVIAVPFGGAAGGR